MDNYQISAHLCMDSRELTRRCSPPRGNFAHWVLRQILISKWYDLSNTQREYLITTLQDLLGKRPLASDGIGDALLKGVVVLPIPSLQQLVDYYRRSNPFIEKSWLS